MIFPKVRISQLKSDRDAKRARLDQSIAIFKGSAEAKIGENTNPLKLLMNHPGWTFGGLASGLAALKLTSGLLRKRGVFAQMFSLGGAMLLKNVVPPLLTLLTTVVGRMLKKHVD